MKEIKNPVFSLKDKNIFQLRQIDYDRMMDVVRRILEPVSGIGFEIETLELKNSRFSSGELSKTIRDTLSIRLKKGTSTIDLSMFIPKLIDGNYIVINGRRKIPLFQLFDIPTITRGETIKFRTNVATMMVIKSKDVNDSNVYLSFLGKKVPMCVLLFAYFGIEPIVEKFELLTATPDKKSTDLYELLVYDLKQAYEADRGFTQDDYILSVGREYTKYNTKSKGEDVIYALEIIPQIDIFTAEFMTKLTILEEIVEAMKIGYIDDTLFTNKRVRCFEYIIYSKLIKNVFDLSFSNRTTRQPKFNINSNQIVSDCNVSDIVQFDFSINPIEELTKLSRISLLGPGGFKRENIPKHLRDVCDSMYGRICPVDTPDRDNCGVLQNLIPNVKLDEKNQFTMDYAQEQPISIPVSLVPFCEHDDQTRLQMASSQMRQSILLKKFDSPLIASGCEWLYTDKTQFVKTAKKDGEVIHIDTRIMLVRYDDGEIDIFNISYRKIYVEHMDFLRVYVNIGDKFKKDDILAESNYCNKGKITLGKNLLTGVMVYYGNNYEDGIVISDRLAGKDDVLTSVHFRDLSFTIPANKVLLSLEKGIYKPIPNELETVEVGKPYAIIKTMNAEDLYSVFNEATILEAEKRFLISEINIYANEYCEDIPEYKAWISEKLEAQKERENYVQKIIRDNLVKVEADRFIKEKGLDTFSFFGKYKEKKERINGVRIEMYGIHFRKIRVGDKIGNRHGNKGVIAKIVEHDKMPQLEDGRHLDVCINPLGIISRMNIGQLYELHLSMSVYDLKQTMTEMVASKQSQDEIKKYLLDYIKIVDNTKNGWYYPQMEASIPDEITKEWIENTLQIIQPPMESVKIDQVIKALEYTGTCFKQKIYDPVSKNYILNPVAVGYMYFFRMVHIAEEKLAARGIGVYAKRTLQPLGGRRNKGGQRCGEMETACIIGHDAPINLAEFLTTKSDCIDLKNQLIRDLIETGLTDDSKHLDATPESVKLLDAYLTVIGVKTK